MKGSPFDIWNNPMYRNDPFAPWNNPIDNNPFSCWNDPFGKGNKESEKQVEKYKKEHNL